MYTVYQNVFSKGYEYTTYTNGHTASPTPKPKLGKKSQANWYLILSIQDSIEKLIEHLIARKLSRDLKVTDIPFFQIKGLSALGNASEGDLVVTHKAWSKLPSARPMMQRKNINGSRPRQYNLDESFRGVNATSIPTELQHFKEWKKYH